MSSEIYLLACDVGGEGRDMAKMSVEELDGRRRHVDRQIR